MNFSRISLNRQGLLFGVFKSPYIKALRPRQWTKNLVVFAAPLFAFNINRTTLLGCVLAFVLFCCVSSGFYLINDIADVKSDRLHPIKCKRPIAAGQVSIPSAIAMAAVLLVGALTVGFIVEPLFGVTLLAYALLQVAYNLKLKRMPILDILAIATGFVLRACGGAVVTGLPLSPWFLLCTAMLALFLGVEKRKAELRLLETMGGKTRAVLKHYSLPLLTRMESTVTTGALMSYALWSSGPQVNGASTKWMILTFPFVLYGIFRYQLLSDVKSVSSDPEDNAPILEVTERPDEVLLTDAHILVTVASWVLAVFVISMLKHQGWIS